MTIVRLLPAQGHLVDLLRAEAARATQRNQRPFVEFGGDAYPSSRALDDFLMDQRMADAFQDIYLVQLDRDAWRQQAGPAGFPVLSIPAFFELDAEGRPTGRKIDRDAWGKDAIENMARVLRRFLQEGNCAPGPGGEEPGEDVSPEEHPDLCARSSNPSAT